MKSPFFRQRCNNLTLPNRLSVTTTLVPDRYPVDCQINHFKQFAFRISFFFTEFDVLVVRHFRPLAEGVESLVHNYQRPSILEVFFNTTHDLPNHSEESNAFLFCFQIFGFVQGLDLYEQLRWTLSYKKVEQLHVPVFDMIFCLLIISVVYLPYKEVDGVIIHTVVTITAIIFIFTFIFFIFCLT